MNPVQNDTVDRVNDEDLYMILGQGREQIRSSYALARELGVKQRHIGFMVNRLRAAGKPVGSEHGYGYFIITCRSELDATCQHIEKRKAGIDATLRALEASWRELHG